MFASRHLGHANPSMTLGEYCHLFACREHGDLVRQALDASYEALTRQSTSAESFASLVLR